MLQWATTALKNSDFFEVPIYLHDFCHFSCSFLQFSTFVFFLKSHNLLKKKAKLTKSHPKKKVIRRLRRFYHNTCVLFEKSEQIL